MSLVYGVHPVLAYLTTEPERVERLWIANTLRGAKVDKIYEIARGQRIRIDRIDRGEMGRIAPEAVHQGVAAKVAEVAYLDPEDLLERALAASTPPFLLALDQVQDPIHLGTALRSAHLLGAQGILITKDRAVGLTPAAIKASAGAAASVPVARAVNLARTLEAWKKAGIWVVGAAMEGEPCDEADLTGPICLVVGGEGKGLRPLTRQRCDRLVSIPMQRDAKAGVESFSASVAASILLYEVDRQRRRAFRS